MKKLSLALLVVAALAATPAFAPFVRPGDTVQAFRIGGR